MMEIGIEDLREYAGKREIELLHQIKKETPPANLAKISGAIAELNLLLGFLLTRLTEEKEKFLGEK